MKGYVYVLTNRALPGLVKIGFSLKDPEIRRRELSGTALPYEFEVVYEALVDGPLELEQRIHSHLHPYRVSDRREFFNLTDSAALQAVQQFFEEVGVQPIYESSFVEGAQESSKTQVADVDNNGFAHWEGTEPFFLDCFGIPALVRDRSTTYAYVDDIDQWKPKNDEGGWTYLWIDDLSKTDYQVLRQVSFLGVGQHSARSVELLNRLLRDPLSHISMLGVPAESHAWIEDPRCRLRVLNLTIEDTVNCEEIRITGPLNCLQICTIPRFEHASSRTSIVLDSKVDRLCVGSDFDRHGYASRTILTGASTRIGEITLSAPLPANASPEFKALLRKCGSANISVSAESYLPAVGTTRVRSIHLSKDCELSPQILGFIANQASVESITGCRLTESKIPYKIRKSLPKSLRFVVSSYIPQPMMYWSRNASGDFVPHEARPLEGLVTLATRLTGRRLEVLDWLDW